MRARDVLLGLGAVGLTVAAAKLIADAVSIKKVSLPPPSKSNQGGAALVDRTPTAAINTAVPASELCRTNPACWCWSDGMGTAECADFDYGQTQSIDENAGTSPSDAYESPIQLFKH